MKKEDVNTFNGFLKYFQNETDRGAALVGAAMLDARLERILDMVLINNISKKDIFEGANSPLGSFSSKIRICHVFGFINDKEAREINLIRKIRNEFAHNLDEVKFATQPVCDFCMQLEASQPGNLKEDKAYRWLFTNSVVLTALALWYRPEYILKGMTFESKDWERSI